MIPIYCKVTTTSLHSSNMSFGVFRCFDGYMKIPHTLRRSAMLTRPLLTPHAGHDIIIAFKKILFQISIRASITYYWLLSTYIQIHSKIACRKNEIQCLVPNPRAPAWEKCLYCCLSKCVIIVCLSFTTHNTWENFHNMVGCKKISLWE